MQPLWWAGEECEYCTSGRERLCHRRRITGEHVDGGYAEYLLANAAHTYRVPEALGLVAAVLSGSTTFDKLDVGPGAKVGVYGLGGVGHMAVQLAALTGAEVVAIGRSRDHLDVARELGASRVVDSTREDPAEVFANELDAVLTSAPSTTVTEQTLASLAWDGTLVAGVVLKLAEFPFAKAQTIKAAILGNGAQMAGGAAARRAGPGAHGRRPLPDARGRRRARSAPRRHAALARRAGERPTQARRRSPSTDRTSATTSAATSSSANEHDGRPAPGRQAKCTTHARSGSGTAVRTSPSPCGFAA
ncbi:zinc-binding dehydrogenase [Amycolatopsis sp. FDAARGOS 1241]|uniref:zinc-binding dehydrogenase n=1 Tax=Amycolatopsis sp. FDAARGOS 1241 TaxID=2778070 RepID=UPI00351C9FC4